MTNPDTIYNPNAAVKSLMRLQGQHLYVMRTVEPGFNSAALDTAVSDGLRVVAESQFEFENLVRASTDIATAGRKLCRKISTALHIDGTLKTSDLPKHDQSLERFLRASIEAFTSFFNERPRSVEEDYAFLSLITQTSSLTLELKVIGAMVSRDEELSELGVELDELSDDARSLHSATIEFATHVNTSLIAHIQEFGELVEEQTKSVPDEGDAINMCRFLKAEFNKLVSDFGSFLGIARNA